MAGKEISGKGSANSELKKPNCSRIDMEGATINSGYHSGREKNREKNEKASSSDLEGCKGTDRSYNAPSGHTLDLGALSGSSINKQSGTVDKGSNVSGTRGSFNAGSSAPCKGSKQHSPKDIPGSESSFNSEKLRKEATIKAAYGDSVAAVKGPNIIGTLESFNVKGQHSKIEGRGANINSGACAGIADAKNEKRTH